MSRRWPARVLVAVALVLAVLAVAAALVVPADAAAAEPLDHRPPVDAEVVDPFRPPLHRFGPGNRGLDYAVEPDTSVVASARGVVAFAGQVGDSLHVTVLHPDGVRTTYAFLRSVSVRRGEWVEQGREVGRAGETLHFGARLGDEYLDPRSLFGATRGHARLVPDDEVRPASPATERRLVLDLLRRVGGTARDGAAAVVQATAAATKAELQRLAAAHRQVAAWLSFVGDLSPTAWLSTGLLLARMSGGDCTPPDQPPPRPNGRRVLVLVAGLGSSSASAAVDAVDAASLGYAAHDVHRFSYRGGTVAERAYAARDTATGDLGRAAAHLRELLRRLADEHPGVPVDVVAHSQGGLVARDALTRPGLPPTVRTLVTLGTPHQGAELAASLLRARRDPSSAAVEALLRTVRLIDVASNAPALRQLATGSTYLRDLARRRLPPSVHVTSVAARADLVVASPSTRLDGAHNVIVTVDGLHDHAKLPGSASAQREVALAVAGRPPTCRDRVDTVVDALAAGFVLRQQRLAGPELHLGIPVRPMQ